VVALELNWIALQNSTQINICQIGKKQKEKGTFTSSFFLLVLFYTNNLKKMALTNYLTKTNFYAYSGLSASDVNDAYVDFMITKFNNTIVKLLTKLFTLTNAQTFKYYKKNSEKIVIIGAWQETGLIVKKGEDGNATLTTLTKNTNYRLINHQSILDPQEDNPVIAVYLYDNFVDTEKEYLQIEGTLGFGDGIPDELMLDADLYEILKKAVLSSQLEKDSGGQGKIASSHIDVVSVSFDSSTSGLTTRQALTECISKLKEIEQLYSYNPDDYAKVLG
jgi:hypothetical protein